MIAPQPIPHTRILSYVSRGDTLTPTRVRIVTSWCILTFAILSLCGSFCFGWLAWDFVDHNG